MLLVCFSKERLKKRSLFCSCTCTGIHVMYNVTIGLGLMTRKYAILCVLKQFYPKNTCILRYCSAGLFPPKQQDILTVDILHQIIISFSMMYFSGSEKTLIHYKISEKMQKILKNTKFYRIRSLGLKFYQSLHLS